MCASAAADLWSGLGLFGVSMATRFLCHPIPYYNRIVKSVQIVNLQLENTGGDERRSLESGQSLGRGVERSRSGLDHGTL